MEIYEESLILKYMVLNIGMGVAQFNVGSVIDTGESIRFGPTLFILFLDICIIKNVFSSLNYLLFLRRFDS
jgi:hypothetical protein